MPISDKARRIKEACKEREFVREIESLPNFKEWKTTKGSHVKGCFRKPDGTQITYPYAAHSGEISPGVRVSWVKFLITMGLLATIMFCIFTDVFASVLSE